MLNFSVSILRSLQGLLKVLLSVEKNLDTFRALSFVDCCSQHLSPDHAIMIRMVKLNGVIFKS
ncbi:hypothetical protein MA16_Dca028802 [Dendrobium catenatum]|uniref:Uncharacterized protein n=1 Tax=Dendrobium catenatum TaxID=906689 RepID=A0A2I0V6N3_9ASPA|nr:hypothetical protein MA16_Dca028802 [Dendrobium catenatum]